MFNVLRNLAKNDDMGFYELGSETLTTNLEAALQITW
jgi:hypothetical protein